jgi:CDP-4-dehydro-6-deoxyglucose reductase
MQSIKRLAPTVLQVELAMLEPPQLTYRAGQYIIVLIEGAKRAYTLASPAGSQSQLTLLVKLLPGGPGSHLFETIGPGGEITFMGPHGFFLLQPGHPGDVVMVGTGIGVAPFPSMLHEILGRPGETGNVHVLWGLRRAADAYPLEMLTALQQAHPRLTVEHLDGGATGPESGWDALEQRLTERVVDQLFPALKSPTFYLSGNGTLIRTLTKELTARGVDRKRSIASEIFYAQSEP